MLYEKSFRRALENELPWFVLLSISGVADLALVFLAQDFTAKAIVGIIAFGSWLLLASCVLRVRRIYFALGEIRKQKHERQQLNAKKYLWETSREYGQKLGAKKYPYGQERVFYRAVVGALDAGISCEESVRIVREAMGEIKGYLFDLEYEERVEESDFNVFRHAAASLVFLDVSPETKEAFKSEKGNCTHFETPWEVQ